MMRQNGWDVTGIETDHRMVEHLETNVGIKANHTTEINKMKKKKLTFDLISLNKVLEHIYDPLNFLKDILSFLDVSGVMYIELPSASAAKEGKFREEFYVEHFHVFSIGSFKKLAYEAKLNCISIQDIIEPSGKFTLFGFFEKS